MIDCWMDGWMDGSKTNISKFHLESVDEKPLCGDATAKFQLIFYYNLIIF